MLLQDLLEIATCVAGGMLGNILWSAANHNLTSLIATLRTEINNPVSTTNHIEIMLNNEDRISLIYKALHHIHQLMYVIEAESCGGLINEIDPGAAVLP